jgi:uncharacterized membrane protein
MQTRPELAERVHHAKEPLAPVAGPYGHPFHPILVTVPIGAWVCSLVFDIVAKAQSGGNQALTYASYWLIGIGVLVALVAAIFGMMDLSRVPQRSRAMRMGLTHMTLNLTVVALYLVGFVWRNDTYRVALEPKGGQLALSVVALALLGTSGWIGGMLAYRYGVRVADEQDQLEAYEQV